MKLILAGMILLAAGLLAALLRARAAARRQREDLDYICRRVETLLREGGAGAILVPTENAAVRQTARAVNQLLEAYGEQQAEARRYRRKSARALTNISHDLKTPLTVLKGYTEILQDRSRQMGLDAETRALIHKLDVKTGETVHRVTQFFNLARLESVDTALQTERVNVSQLCREVLLEFYDLLEQRHTTVNIAIPSPPVFADTDPEALSRVLRNLIDNAIKYGGDGHFLGVCLREDENTLQMSVEDHGKGIPKAEIDRIFERAYTLESGKGRDRQGSGLGLAIVRSQIHQLGGSVRADSQPGLKTVFTVTLKK